VIEADPREELALLAQALRAYVERCERSGAFGLPRATPEDIAARPGLARVDPGRATPEDIAARPGLASVDPGHTTARKSAPALGSPASADGPAPGSEHPAAAARAEPPGIQTAPGSSAPGAPGGAAQAEPGDAPASVAASGPNETARARLAVLATEVAGCTRCGLHAGRTQTVFARGTGSSGVCFVGEGPGADEDAQGFPFVGKAGQLLDRMIGAMGLDRDEVYVCNIVKCRPPKNRKPEGDEMAACRPFLMEQLELVDPKVIVALGATAVEGLLGVTGGITRLRGSWRLYRGRIAVMPTFHPAYLLRNPEAKREVWSDLQDVMKHLGRPLAKR
jgi:DNA polymerase